MKKTITMWPRCLIVGAAVLAASSQVAAQALQHDGKPFAVAGERVDAPLPAGARLAYMAGSASGEFIAEFASPQEDIARWRSLFVAQQRVNDTLPNTVKRTLQGMQSACKALNKPKIFAPKKGTARFKGQMLAVSLRCQQAMPNAPLGELSTMLFLQGQTHTFKYWRAWRPQNPQQLQTALQESADFLAAGLQQVELCQPQAGRACRHALLPQ